MARKKEFNYFTALANLALKGEEAAKVLLVMIQEYDYEKNREKIEKIHLIENEADTISREILDELNHSFVTPIDREDIVGITENLDDIVDGINALAYLFDTYLIKDLRPKTEKIAGYVVEATEGITIATNEFAKFKHSKTLKSMIAQVNKIEEKTDDLYRALIKELFTREADVLNVVKWKSVYEGFEKVINNTEIAADNLEGLVIKNT